MAIFTALVATISSVGTWFAGLGAIAQAAVQIGAGLAFNALSAALAGKPEAPKEPGIVGELQQGADIPRAFLMGRRATAGSLAYHNQWGGTENEFYTRITALSDLPITGLVEMWIDGKLYQLDKANPHADYGCPILGLSETRTENRRVELGFNDDKGTTIYGMEEVEVTETLGWVKFYDGTQIGADSFVATDVATEERPWSANEVGTGVAYAITTFKLNRQVFQGLPEILFVCDGIAMYDVSSDTTGHSENPLVMCQALVSGLSYGGQWFYGPQTSARLDLTEHAIEVAKCNQLVPGGAEMSEAERIAAFGSATVPARYRASMEVQVNRNAADVIEDLITACNGRVSEVGTRYRFQVGDPGATVLSMTDDDIVSTAPQSFSPFFPLAETVNAITATYPAPADGWKMQDAPPLYRPDLEAADGDRRLPAGVQLNAVPFPEQVQRLMAASLAEARRARRHTLVLPARYWVLEPGDFIPWTSNRNGYDAKLFRVDGVRDQPNGDVAVDLTEVDPLDYSWSAGSDFRPVVPGSLSGVVSGLATVAGWDVKPVTLPGDGGDAQQPGLALLWTAPPVGSVDGLAYQVRRVSSSEMIADGSVTDVTMGLAVISSGLIAGTVYEARARYVTPRGSTWTSWVSATTPNAGFGSDAFKDSIAELAFEAGIRSLFEEQGLHLIEDVATLPASGTLGQKVFLRSDGKLYEWNGTAWVLVVAAVSAPDISGQLAAAQIAVNAVTESKIAAGAVAAGKLATNAVAAINIQTSAITETKIANGSISTPKIAAGAITAGTIAAGAITTGKIAAGVVSATEIAAGAVTAEKIGALQVTAEKIASNSITSAKIVAGTIQANDIAAGTITGYRIAGNTITGNKVVANTITGGLLATSGIITNSAQINNGLITNAKIANLAVDSAKIANAAITSAKIGSLQVQSANIANLTVGGEKIANFATSNVGSGAGVGSQNIPASWTVITSFTFSTVGSKTIHISAMATAVNYDGGAEGNEGRGNIRIRSGGFVSHQVNSASGEVPLLGIATSSAGSTTVYLEAQKASGNGNYGASGRMVAVELRK